MPPRPTAHPPSPPSPPRSPTARLGIALGGGAAFGYAHMGVLEAFAEAGLRPDLLAGSSSGAVAAALAAFAAPAEAIEARFAGLAWSEITNFKPRRLGLFDNEELGELVTELIGERRIEEAPVTLRIVATDIESGDKVVLSQGPVAPAVRASASLPGLYLPVEIDGRLLVDGGIVEIVPVTPLRDAGADVVVGVSLMSAPPFERVESLPQVLINAAALTLRTASLAAAETVDVLIEPDLSERKPWDMSDMGNLRAVGKEAGRQALPTVRRALQEAATG